jgi:hypothetical protein
MWPRAQKARHTVFLALRSRTWLHAVAPGLVADDQLAESFFLGMGPVRSRVVSVRKTWSRGKTLQIACSVVAAAHRDHGDFLVGART